MTRHLLVSIEVEANPTTCGACSYLRRLRTSTTQQEWWCDLFQTSRGWIGAQKTPNRTRECRESEPKSTPDSAPG